MVLHHFLGTVLYSLDERLIFLQVMPSYHFGRVQLELAIAKLFFDSILDTLKVPSFKKVAQIFLLLFLFLTESIDKQRVYNLFVVLIILSWLFTVRVDVWVAPARITVNLTIILNATYAPATRRVALAAHDAPGANHGSRLISRMLNRSGRH